MKPHFHEGQKLKAVFFPEEGEIIATADTTITVVMENGQAAEVPWVIVESQGSVRKWNLALLLGVELEAK